jgi:DMSO/TMAO reductase YedYZ molybdopterin-dependent catalytic subunit
MDEETETDGEVGESVAEEEDSEESASESAWLVVIVGPGGEENEISIEAIKALPSVELEAEQKGEMITFQGVVLGQILSEVGISSAEALNVTAADGYSATISGEVAFSDHTIIAYASNGEDLSSDEKSGPLRLVTTEESPQVWVGQLTTIEVE